ncbi:beta-ketoacyl synthase N-terminal-like domain-containing protein [Nocardiopsis coralliicola]
MPRSSRSEERAIAIIGVAGRFPGRTGSDGLWELLRDGVDATSETPRERYAGEPSCADSAAGAAGAHRAGYLDGVAEFDAEFFNFSPTEAAELDPQQRLLMMSVWEALENAGQPAGALAGSRTGTFVGNAQSDYLDLQRRQGLSPTVMNNYRSLLPGRLSHIFDFRGPSVLVDSACSSSLVAVHLAVQSLRAGEVPLAVAAGVNLKLVPDESVLMAKAGTLSSDGRSRFADAAADGYAPSDGVGVVVLKPLADAVADGDRVRAVILGSAVGNDGCSSESLMAPSVAGQTGVLRAAYDDAGVDPAEVDFVEAHGAASAGEDAVELTALSEVLGEGRPADRPCFVGSVKANIGHSQAAAGITGLIKAVLCLERGQVPASLHFDTPNPALDWDRAPLSVPTGLQDLPRRGRPLIAGVTAQGMSCLNAHVVVGQGQAHTAGRRPERPGGQDAAYVLPLSARTPQALQDLAHAYAAYLEPGGAGSGFSLRDICYSAATRRHHHGHRSAVVAASHEQMAAALRAFGRGARGTARAQAGPPVLPIAAQRYRDGLEVDWDAEFGPHAAYVPLPGHPWRLKRYWMGEQTGEEQADSPVDAVLRQHARAAYAEDSALSDIGIDSLALLRIIVALSRDHGYEVDLEDLAELRTVSAFRQWFDGMEVAAA